MDLERLQNTERIGTSRCYETSKWNLQGFEKEMRCSSRSIEEGLRPLFKAKVYGFWEVCLTVPPFLSHA